jgi:hypothetical protein
MALVSMGCCLQAQAASQVMTFKQAVEKGTGLKGCARRNIGSIESVYVSDSGGDPKGVRPGRPIYLVFQSAGATDMPVIGPLATLPTERQLLALHGQRTCVISE